MIYLSSPIFPKTFILEFMYYNPLGCGNAVTCTIIEDSYILAGEFTCFIKVDFIFSKGRTIKRHSGIIACLVKDCKVWV